LKILWAGKDYPGGFDNLRNGAKKAFFAMKEEKDPEKIQQAIARVSAHIIHSLRTINFNK